ncbi:M3 family oligoendopeptidase [Anaerosporobacter faecicola]|uniref:M3 family oligoendopeptidase n=1 Tax=Anaerosporobacter faecicola TaxID=2718714 RepID=UPI001439356A|nr:M3 family oligoendopeptidase [Anaerosporobacter faecicola]
MNEKDYKFSDLVYVRPDYTAIQNRINELTEQIKEAKEYKTIRDVILKSNEIQIEQSYAENVACIRMYQDCTNTFYEEESLKNSEEATYLDWNKLSKALIDSPFVGQIEEEFGVQYITLLKNKIQLFEEGKDLIVKSQALEMKYQQLKASLKFEIDGKVVGEAELLKYYESLNREQRKKAVEERYKVYINHKDEFEDILNQLVDLRIEIAKANGFDSYLDYMNLEKGRVGYGEKELTGFCDQVKEVLVPFCTKLNEAKKRRLGLTELKIYDNSILFADGNPEPKGSNKELFEAARKMYHELSKEAGEFFDLMLAHEMIDAEPSQNKVAGMGFCADIAKIKMPFVFGNFNGTISDVTVLTHEIGHAFQMYASMQKQSLIQYNVAVNDMAEVPSKTMEQFAYPFAEYFFGEDADKFRFMHLSNVMEEICSYCMIHEYETYLYNTPEATSKERALEYANVYKRYMPDYDFGELEDYIEQGAMLYGNMGIYMFPRYLISYSLSNMCALEFKQKMIENPKEAWEDYSKLCSAGGSLGYPELLHTAGLSLAYEEGVVTRVTKRAQEILEEYMEKELI